MYACERVLVNERERDRMRVRMCMHLLEAAQQVRQSKSRITGILQMEAKARGIHLKAQPTSFNLR